MEFKDSGLPQIKLVEDAFNYSKANALAGEKEMLKNVQQQVGMIFDQQKMMLDFSRQAGDLSESEYEAEKAKLEKQRQQQMGALTPMIQKGLIEMFSAKRVGPARELQQYADNASPDVLAAVMLVDCVRSPIDYENLEKKFGSTVAGLVAEVSHIDAYPSERGENLKKAGLDTKRAFLARVITDLEGVSKEIAKASKNPFNKIMLPPGQEEQLYNDALPVWGNDKKLDARFVALFNKVGEGASSTYRVEVGAKGELELVKDVAPAKPPKLLPGPKGPKPPKPPGNGGIGGDVF
jgi:hypothetical protein